MSEAERARSPLFATTRWSVVIEAGEGTAERSREALAWLCERYWLPLYAYLRRLGEAPEDARDTVQGLFARLLERGDLGRADPARGRFRSFLLAALRHHLANERAAARARKRGGGVRIVSLDIEGAEERLGPLSDRAATPERIFAAEWARTLLDSVLDRLAAEYEARGQGDLFRSLQGRLAGEPGGSGGGAASAPGPIPGARRVALHRMRRRYREILRREIAETLADPAEVDEEIRDLFEAVGP